MSLLLLCVIEATFTAEVQDSDTASYRDGNTEQSPAHWLWLAAKGSSTGIQ